MRYIEKETPSDEFVSVYNRYKAMDWGQIKIDGKLKVKWDRFRAQAGLSDNGNVKENMLRVEQKDLCAYCERKIDDISNSHAEHIEPKSLVPSKTIEYNNIIISCNGKQCNDINSDEDSCGHKKDNEHLVLVPTLHSDISSYFEFERLTGKIIASQKDRQKAEETIKVLNLDSVRLNKSRYNAYITIQTNMINHNIKKPHNYKNIFYTKGYVTYLENCFKVKV